MAGALFYKIHIPGVEWGMLFAEPGLCCLVTEASLCSGSVHA